MGQKEYNYEYDAGKVVRATECVITVNENEFITSKSLVNTVFYTYNDDKLTRKRIVAADGAEQVVYYENTDDNTVVKFTAGGKTVTSHSKTDSFGRKVFDELQLGTGFVYLQALLCRNRAHRRRKAEIQPDNAARQSDRAFRRAYHFV